MSHIERNYCRILLGDCRETLKTLPDNSVHCVVTSPPYWGLRDYGTATWIGGDEGCDHAMDASPHTGLAYAAERCDGNVREESGAREAKQKRLYRETCGKCGAKRIDFQIGLEPTPEEYVANMAAVFREVKRVLRDDGTCWLNLGDSYANANPGSGGKCVLHGAGEAMTKARYTNITRDVSSLKPKDLVGIPWRVAFALQADGWWLRQDIIWEKPNPMPESVTDRCTKAHEYVFLLAKSQRYFYDAVAIKEDGAKRLDRGRNGSLGRIGQQGWSGEKLEHPECRNKRSVWNVSTTPYKGAHFATFPPKLIEPMILAGTSAGGCCRKCGAPLIRAESDTEKQWQFDCECNAGEPIPCVVLDPFGGSGTTAAVSNDLGRFAIVCELNPEYVKLIHQRAGTDQGRLFMDIDES